MNWFKPFLVADILAIVALLVSVAAAVEVIAMHWGESLRLGNVFDWKRKRPPKPPKP